MNSEEYVRMNHLLGLFMPITENLAISKGKIVLDCATETLVFINFMDGNELICSFNPRIKSAIGLKFEFDIDKFLNLKESLYSEMNVLDIRIQKQNDKWYLLSDEMVDSSKKLYYPPDFFDLAMKGDIK